MFFPSPLPILSRRPLSSHPQVRFFGGCYFFFYLHPPRGEAVSVASASLSPACSVGLLKTLSLVSLVVSPCRDSPFKEIPRRIAQKTPDPFFLAPFSSRMSSVPWCYETPPFARFYPTILEKGAGVYFCSPSLHTEIFSTADFFLRRNRLPSSRGLMARLSH